VSRKKSRGYHSRKEGNHLISTTDGNLIHEKIRINEDLGPPTNWGGEGAEWGEEWKPSEVDRVAG